jgi:AcrR family transcriptional regulator
MSTRSTPSSAADAAVRGRPRSSAADDAILAAARDLLAEGGWAGLTVEGVAVRAGVAKTTVYRRFSSRADLAVAVLAETIATTEARLARSDDPAERVRIAVRACAENYRLPASRAAFLAVISEADRDPALRAAVEAHVVAPARRLVLEGLALGLERGEASPEAAAAVATSDLLFDLIVGTLVHRVLIRGEDVDDTFVEQLVGAVLAVLSSALPTRPAHRS